MAFEFEDQIRADDPVLWAWLENRQTWKHVEQRLLWRMLEASREPVLPDHLARAETLAKDTHPSRASSLGWIENRMGFPERSIPLLRYAMESTDEDELKHQAAFALLESYLDTEAWEQAEQIFPSASRRLTARELPQWYGRIAVLAASKGSPSDAMRIWKRAANLDLTMTAPVNELAKAGLNDELVAFYRQMQRTLPRSGIPPRVLAQLATPPVGAIPP